MNVLRLTETARLGPIAPAGGAILAMASMAANTLKHDLTITCGSDSHPPTDPHTLGEAIDLRTRDLSEAQILRLVTILRESLGPLFTVLYEVREMPAGVLAGIAYVNPGASAPHIHVQRKRGTTYPREQG